MWIRLAVSVQATVLAKCPQQSNEGLEEHWVWGVLCQASGCRSSWAGSEQAWKLPVLLSLPAKLCITPALLIVDCDQMGMKRPGLTTRNSPRSCLEGRGRHGWRVPLDTAFPVFLFRTQQRKWVLQVTSTRHSSSASAGLEIFLQYLYCTLEENNQMSSLAFYSPNLRATGRPS